VSAGLNNHRPTARWKADKKNKDVLVFHKVINNGFLTAWLCSSVTLAGLAAWSAYFHLEVRQRLCYRPNDIRAFGPMKEERLDRADTQTGNYRQPN